MKQFAANYIFPVTSNPIKNGIVVTDDSGIIIEIIDTHGKLSEKSNIQFFNGVIVPGFINTHTHLELSYLKGAIPNNCGHKDFIKHIVKAIEQEPVDFDKIACADILMKNNGIVAVADISNTPNSAEVKQKSTLFYYSFIEQADFFSKIGFDKALESYEKIKNKFLNKSLVAHAPYSTSIDFIEKSAAISQNIYSIHNQEAPDEDLMYLKAQGDMFQLMTDRQLINKFTPTGKSTIKSYLPKIVKNELNVLLVHNIYTTEEEIQWAEQMSENLYWVLCPLSNLFIQNVKINYNKFLKNNCKITLGTDSLASNHTLNILEEMNFFEEVEFEIVLRWATINGAKALKIDKKYGSIEKGKQPGLNLIEDFDFQQFKPRKTSKIKKLI